MKRILFGAYYLPILFLAVIALYGMGLLYALKNTKQDRAVPVITVVERCPIHPEVERAMVIYKEVFEDGSTNYHTDIALIKGQFR